MVPSPNPSKNLKIINAVDPPVNLKEHFLLIYFGLKQFYLPNLIVTGVIRVKIVVDKIPKLSKYFPPNFAAKTPPGT